MELLQPDHLLEEKEYIQHSPIIIPSSPHSIEYNLYSPKGSLSQESEHTCSQDLNQTDMCITPLVDTISIHSPNSQPQMVLSRELVVEEDDHPFRSPSQGDWTDQDSGIPNSPFDSMNSSQLSIKQREEVKKYTDDDLSIEERYERLNTLLERSTLFTEVVGGQVRRQQEERKQKQKRRPLKDLILTDISSQEGNLLSQESVENAGPERKRDKREAPPLTRKRSLESPEGEQGPKRFKPVNVRYFNDEIIPFEQPRLLTGGVLRDYQLDGYDWLRILYENGINGILADEMGLGKTIQAIALICYLVERGVKGPFMVVAPLTTMRNWQREFARFAPTINTIIYYGDKVERASLLKKIKSSGERGFSNKCPVVITHYDLIRIDFRKIMHMKWSYLVMDEGHKAKCWRSHVNKCLNMFHCESRVILTGTPIQNNLSELWSVLNLLMPAIFTDRNIFLNWFDVRANMKEEVVKREREKPIIEMIQKIIRPFIMRRMKSGVSLNLPPKKEILVYCPLTRVQKKFYKALLNRTVMSMIRDEYGIQDALETEVGEKVPRASRANINYREMDDNEFMDIINGFETLPFSWTGETVAYDKPDLLPVYINVTAQRLNIHMRKVVNHPYLLAHPYDQLESGRALIISEDTVQLSGKMRILDQMLKNLIPKGHKMLIYSQWVRILDLIEDLMELREIEFERIDGKKSLSLREEAIDNFQTNTEVKCFLISTRAGGLGLNLIAADTVIIFDSDWNPHVDQQAQDRCHRIGQTLPVIVYRLVAAHTIDQRLVERAFTKKKLDKILINNKDFCKNSWTQNKISPLCIEDLQELLTELEYDKQIGEGDEFTEEQMRTLLDRPNLFEGATNKVFTVISDEPQRDV